MDKLFLKYREALLVYLTYRCNYDKCLAEDLTMDTYIKLKECEIAGKYEERGCGKSFIFMTATNVWRDYLRKIKSHSYNDWWQGTEISKVNLLAEDGKSSEEELIEKDTREQVVKILNLMKGNIGVSMRRRYLDGWAYAEIAEETDLSINTILGHGRYGRKKVKLLLSA